MFFFGEVDFDQIDTSHFFSQFNQVTTLKRSKNIHIYSINEIKVDFVNYSYSWLQHPIIEGGIRLASMEDIAAMKPAAVTGRGSKKNFINIYFLLQQFTLSEMMNFYQKKYFDGATYLELKSLTYFEDAETELGINMMKKVTWTEIKTSLLQTVADFNLNTH